MFQRIKNLWKLSKIPVSEIVGDNSSSIFDSHIIEGNGKAEILGEGTEQEYEESIDEELGWKKWLKKNNVR